MGASPGLVNLLAVVAMSELDDVHRVITGWNGEGAMPEPGSGPAAVEHGIAQATGTIPVIRDESERPERPLRRVAVDYPELGRRRARTFGHPEPVTLHRTFGVTDSVNVIVAGPLLDGTPVLPESIRPRPPSAPVDSSRHSPPTASAQPPTRSRSWSPARGIPPLLTITGPAWRPRAVASPASASGNLARRSSR